MKKTESGNKMGVCRGDVFKFAEEHYGTKPEYLWAKFPNYAVLRSSANGKWFAVIMDVEREKLGLKGKGKVDIMDVKCSFLARELLSCQKGIVPAYHMNRENWVGVLLDGSADMDMVFQLIEESFAITQRRTKGARTEPTDWIVPANPKYFDIEKAFQESDVILWKQSNGVIVGDIVYVYVAAPVSAIGYRCQAVEVNIPMEYDDGKVRMKKVMKIKLLHKYDGDLFGLEKLREHGIASVRGPRSVPYGLRYELEAASK